MKSEEVKALWDYRDGSLYWKVRPAIRIRIGDKAGCPNKAGYLMLKYKGTFYYVHRLVWLWHGKELIDGHHIDHIDHDKTNNSIENLQQLTPADNYRRRPYVQLAKGRKKCTQLRSS